MSQFATFEPKERAIIVNTNDGKLDGQIVKVVGIASCDYDVIFYIVELGPSAVSAYGPKWTHIVLINSCLQKV